MYLLSILNRCLPTEMQVFTLIQIYINTFLADVPILYPLKKKTENPRFSGVFKENDMKILARNELTCKCSRILNMYDHFGKTIRIFV